MWGQKVQLCGLGISKAWVSDLKHFPESRRQLPGAEQSASCQLSVSREDSISHAAHPCLLSQIDRHLSRLLSGFPKPSVCPASGPWVRAWSCGDQQPPAPSCVHIGSQRSPLGREFCVIHPGGRDASISPVFRTLLSAENRRLGRGWVSLSLKGGLRLVPAAPCWWPVITAAPPLTSDFKKVAGPWLCS